jgi:hypothetical protein
MRLCLEAVRETDGSLETRQVAERAMRAKRPASGDLEPLAGITVQLRLGATPANQYRTLSLSATSGAWEQKR